MDGGTTSPGATEPPDDAEWVRRLKAGDEAAFDLLVRALHGRMVRVARLFSRSDAEAADVAQECWTTVLEHLDGFEGRASLRSWILTIVANRARTRGKQAARLVPESAFPEDGPSPLEGRFDGRGMWSYGPVAWPAEDDPAVQAERRELVALVNDGIERLPEMQRRVITLRDVEGFDGPETCELLGLSDANQRVLLHRARTAVRRHVEARLEEGTP